MWNVASIQNKCETGDNVAVDFKPNVCGDKCILEIHWKQTLMHILN